MCILACKEPELVHHGERQHLRNPSHHKKRAALEAALRLSMKFCSVAPMMMMVMMVVVVVIMMMVRQQAAPHAVVVMMVMMMMILRDLHAVACGSLLDRRRTRL